MGCEGYRYHFPPPPCGNCGKRPGVFSSTEYQAPDGSFPMVCSRACGKHLAQRTRRLWQVRSARLEQTPDPRIVALRTELRRLRRQLAGARELRSACAQAERDAEQAWREKVEVEDAYYATLDELVALRAELGAAGDVFEEYARLHEAKGTPEGEAKARVNRAHAQRCRAALNPVAVAYGQCEHVEPMLFGLTGRCGLIVDHDGPHRVVSLPAPRPAAARAPQGVADA
jgi:hypothetical protein